MKKLGRILVEKYLKFITKIVLWRHKPMVVSVAGTTNKTFIKNQIIKEFSENGNVRGNPRSFNTEIGLPLAILFLPSGYSSIFKWCDILITGTFIALFGRNFPRCWSWKMGVNRKRDMKYLLSIVEPSAAVISNINKSFPDNDCLEDDLAKEMQLLVKAVPPAGTVILNADDARVKNLSGEARSKVILFGRDPDAEARIKNIRRTQSGESFDWEFKQEKQSVKLELFGRHNINAYVAAKLAAGEIRNRINKSKRQKNAKKKEK